ncbi:hypothetical protein KAI58_03160 [Candidatus Gracilibacteria bacterium]|nr:hypothetical protein [Candidatus Gracilibacteria bacterium]
MKNEIKDDVVTDSQASGLEEGSSNEERGKNMSIKITGRGIAERVVKTLKIREAVEQHELRRLDGFLSDLQNPEENMDKLFEAHFEEEVLVLDLSDEEKSD